MDLSALHASQTLCHICLPFKIHNLLLPRKEDYLLVGPLFTENLSKSYLSTRFHKECGQTISDYLLSCRMEQAKKLLRYSSLPIGEVADQCGIGDGSYFAKCFTKWVGMGPEKWRGKK